MNSQFFKYLLSIPQLHYFKKHGGWILAFCIITLLPINLKASQSDTETMMNLVPLAEIDRTVVTSGSWSSPATWSGKELPQAGENIYVPANKTLIVNVVDPTSINTLRVDGTIKFSGNQNVSIRLDTLVVTEKGSFEIGTDSNPVHIGKTVEIIIADNGPIDRQWDPKNMSRGIILHGKTRIFGAEKTAYHPLSTFPYAGDTQIQLAEDPVGWQVGDIIVITATKFRNKLKKDTSYETYDERRRIASIYGRNITFGDINVPSFLAPLDYDHIPLVPSMPVYAANLTRNVIFRGEGGDSIPVGERGHFMVIHNPDVIIKGAGFYYLGRTDKSIPLDDFILDKKGRRVRDSKGNYIPGPNNNPRGRYAVHFHHTGVENIQALPITCSGNAIISSPGWGFVIHGSHVNMENNASFSVFGSHFVTEDGNELGKIQHNIAVRAEGGAYHAKKGTLNHDLGHGGHGFWLEGRNLQVEDNVVSGAFRAGLVYFHRHHSRVTGVNLNIPKDNLLTSHKEIMKGRLTIQYDDIPISHQKHMTVLASGRLLKVVKANANQGHDMRNIFESLKGYAVKQGINLQYTQKYLFKDLVLIADPLSHRWNKGISLEPLVNDVAFLDAQVDGFVHPFTTGTTFKGQPSPTDVVFVNVSVDGRPMDPIADIHNPANIPNVTSNYDPVIHKVLDTEDLIPGKLSFNFSPDMSFELPKTLKWNTGLMITGTKRDSAGATSYNSFWQGNTMLRPILKKGYYTRRDGSKYIVLNDLVVDRLTGKVIPLEIEADIVHDYGRLLGSHLGMEN